MSYRRETIFFGREIRSNVLTTVTSYACCKCCAQDRPAIPPPIMATVDFLLSLLALRAVFVETIAVLIPFAVLESCILVIENDREGLKRLDVTPRSIHKAPRVAFIL